MLKILAICGSLRKDSTNMGLIRYAMQSCKDINIEIADLSQIPFYNSDIQDKPLSVLTLLKQMEQAHGFIFACPEYNYSLAPALKNALDWASREKDNYLLSGKAAGIIGAGGGMGTSRAQYHLRQVCVFLDIHVLNKPEVFSNAFDGSFDAGGNLLNEKIKQNIDNQLLELKKLINKVE